MSSYLSRVLGPGEKILYESELHWVIYRHGIILTILGVLVGHFADDAIGMLLGGDIGAFAVKPVTYIAVAIIVFGAFELIIAYIRQISTELVVTNRRVIAKYGFIATTTFELMIDRVEGANIDQTVLGRMLGFGTVMVHGTGGGISPIDHVANPYAFHACLMRALNAKSEGRSGDRAGKGDVPFLTSGL